MRLVIYSVLLIAISTYGQFYLDKTELNFFGWAKARVQENMSLSEVESIYPTGSLRLREKPTTQSSVLSGMTKNQQVSFLGCADGEWIRISTGFHLGYAHGSFLVDNTRTQLSERCP